MEMEYMKMIKRFCLVQNLDYYKTIVFIECHLEAIKALLNRSLNRIEFHQEINFATIYLTKFGKKNRSHNTT